MPRYRFPGTLAASARPAAPAGPAAATLCMCALETQFPRILDAIQALWGYPELNTYFNKLIIDDRGDRTGFPAEAWDEIFLLMHIHQRIVPTAPR